MHKTPTPVLYNERLIVGGTLIDGTLNTINDDGSLTPEIGAYIYIYVNNILINEDNRVITTGEGRAGVVTVVQDTSESPDLPVGYWSFTCKALAYGSSVVVKAQGPNKLISDYSVTHRVGGSPVPQNIGSLKADGLFSPPVAGDTRIEGEFSGLKNTLFDSKSEYFFPYNRNLDVYPYINGIKQPALPYNKIIGRNFISDFLFFGSNFDVDILVQGEPVNLKLDNFSQLIYEEYVTGLTHDRFVVHPPTDSAFLMNIYCGGRRLAQNTNAILYDYYLSHSTEGDPIVILNSGFDVRTTDVFCVQYIGLSELNSGNYQTLVYQGTTDETYTIPYTSIYQVYKNGLRMLEGISYDFTVVASDEAATVDVTFNRVGGNNIILPTDTIVIDYKIEDQIVPFYGIKQQNPSEVVPEIRDSFSGTSTDRMFYLNIGKGILPDPVYIVIYKDGIKQKAASNSLSRDGDYILESVSSGYYRASFFNVVEEPFEYTYSVVDGEKIFDITNNFVVDFVYTDAARETSIDYLNNLPAMLNNKIEARFETDPATQGVYLVLESPYTLEFPAESTKYEPFFGKFPSLYPGKDAEGYFKFFIDFKRNRWRYSFDRPLKKLMHITASTFPRS